MTVENFQVLVEKLSERRPFHPYIIELSSGEKLEVDHPLALAYRDGIATFIAPGGIPFWFDHEGVVTIIDDTASTAA